MAYTITTSGPLFSNPSPLVDREILAELHDLGTLGKRLLFERTPTGIASGGGGLRGSTFAEVRGTSVHREVLIAQSEFYAEIVDAGRQPGKQPPVARLRRWVELKLGKRGAEAERVTFVIAQKIGREGYEGYHQFLRAFRQLEPTARQRLTVDLPARIARVLGGA